MTISDIDMKEKNDEMTINDMKESFLKIEKKIRKT